MQLGISPVKFGSIPGQSRIVPLEDCPPEVQETLSIKRRTIHEGLVYSRVRGQEGKVIIEPIMERRPSPND